MLNFFKTIFFIDLLLGLMVTFLNLFKKKITIFYPEEKTPKSYRFRGLHALRYYTNGAERCIACKLCESICPALAITIESRPTHDDIRSTIQYEIDLFKCVYCGLCEEACPVDSVVETTFSDFHFENFNERIITKKELLLIGERNIVEITNNLKERVR